MKKKEQEAFEGLLRKVMSFRNAFAHGRPVSDDQAAWIRYFEGSPQEKELTDEYLARIEATIREAGESCSELSSKLGINLGTIEV